MTQEMSTLSAGRWLKPVASPVSVVVTGVIGFVAVLVWGLIVKRDASITSWDQNLLVRINGASSGVMDALARLTSVVFSPPGALVLIVLVVVVISLATRRLGDGLFAGFTVGVIYASTYVAKVIVGRPRPAALPHVVPGLSVDTSPSYPSGHVAMISALVVVLFLVARHGARWAVAVIGGVLMIWTAYARLYVGAHYLDDVVASAVYAVTVGPLVYVVLYWIDSKLGIVAAVDRWSARWPVFRDRAVESVPPEAPRRAAPED